MDKIYEVSGKNIIKMTIDLLDHIKPIGDIKKDTLFGIKPNLVCPKLSSSGATTHAEIVEGIIIYLNDHGFNNIKIKESSWVGSDTKRAFKVCGYNQLSETYNVELVDLKDDFYIEKEYKGSKIKVCKSVYDIDYLINVPLLKGHCQTNITCALKNLKGLIPDQEKKRFHSLGLHKPIAYLNKVIKQDLIITDAICPDPFFEEGGRPKSLNKIFLTFDPVLMDSYAAKILGYKIDDIGYLKIAVSEKIGRPFVNEDQIVNIYNSAKKIEEIKRKDNKFLNLISEADACSHCHSNLVAALRELHENDLSQYIVDEICIGQAYIGYKGKLGIGDCTSDFERYLCGCPPTVEEIAKFLSE